MRRTSNLAFNREFPQRSGVLEIPSGSSIVLRRDRENPFDADAVGVWLESRPDVPMGWLYRKDNNRAPVLESLDRGKALSGRLEYRSSRTNGQKIVVFWL